MNRETILDAARRLDPEGTARIEARMTEPVTFYGKPLDIPLRPMEPGETFRYEPRTELPPLPPGFLETME